MNTRRFVVFVLLMAATASCKPNDQRTDTFDPEEAMQHRDELPAEVVAELDSGSADYRADDHQAALAHYQRAAELAPDAPAAWFGVYMAQHALGNQEAAQDALKKARSVSPSATLLRPSQGDTVR